MANTFDSYLLPKIYAGALEVLREECPLLSAVSKEDSWNLTQYAKGLGQTIVINRPSPMGTPDDVTPSMTPPTPSALTLGRTTVTLDQWKRVSFGVTQSEAQNYNLNNVVPNQMQESIRSLANFISDYLFSFYYQISGHGGTAGTGAFASNINTLATMDWVLSRQRCPKAGRMAYLSLRDVAALKSLTAVQYANQLGDNTLVRQGIVGNLLGFEVHGDVEVPIHTKGTGIAGTLTVDAAAVAGATSVTATAAGGAVALAAGDVITFSVDTTQQYTVTSAVAIDSGSSGTLSLNRPLDQALTTSHTVAAAANMGTGYQCILGNPKGFGLAFRTPEPSIQGAPTQGIHQPLIDQLSGAQLMVSYYPGYQMAMFEVSAMFGGGVVEPNYLARMSSYTSAVA